MRTADFGGVTVDQSDNTSLLRPSLYTTVPTSRNTERYSWACLWDEIKLEIAIDVEETLGLMCRPFTRLLCCR